MIKIIDKIALLGITYFTFFLWAVYITKNFVLGLLIALTFTVIIAIFVKPKERFVADDYIVKLTTLPTTTLNVMIVKITNPTLGATIDENNNVTLSDRTLILPYLKHSPVSADELYHLAINCTRDGYSKLILITNEYDTVGYTKLKPYLSCNVEIISSKAFIESLKKVDLLPDIPSTKKSKPKLITLLKKIINRKCAKYYLVSGLTMGLLALITPLRLYYLVFCTISLTLGLLCLTKRKEKKPSVFI